MKAVSTRTVIAGNSWKILGMVVRGHMRNSPPTVREIARRLRLAPHGVHCALRRLQSKGLIQWEPKEARTLRPTFTVELFDDQMELGNDEAS